MLLFGFNCVLVDLCFTLFDGRFASVRGLLLLLCCCCGLAVYGWFT